MAFNRKSNNLTSSISVLAITIGLVAGQSATQKSLAQFATSPTPSGLTSIKGAGASTVTSLFVGTVDSSQQSNPYPFGSKGTWLNVYGVGNPASLNNNVPPAFLNYPNGDYGPSSSTTTFRYAPVGSGAGIAAFFTPPGTPTVVVVGSRPTPDNNVNIVSPISFAVTDDPLSGSQIEQVAAGNASQRAGSGKAVQVPVIGVGIALAFNDASINQPSTGLKLSRITYCGILNGNITNWNDTRIRNDNGGAIVSSSPIQVVVRADSSGSTFVLSTHLNTICKTAATPGLPTAYVWNRGAATTITWPTNFIKVTGGGALADRIKATPNAIGYVDSATRLSRSLPAALLQNKSGTYVGPTTAGIQAALSGGTIVKYGTAPTNRLIRIDGLADPTVSTAYPISTATYTLFYDVYAGDNTSGIAPRLRNFINWALAPATQYTVAPLPITSTNPTADKIATDRGYAPLPNTIKAVSRTVVGNCVNTVNGTSPCS